MKKVIVLLQLFLTVTYGHRSYKLCVPEGTLKDTTIAIDRGQRVTCVRVTDSTECAIRMAKGEVDFAVFNAEELLLAYQFYPEDLMPLFEIRHKDVPEEEFQFQSVALIPSSMSVVSPGRGFEFLKNSGICLPGFSAEQWWNDHILKYFEKRTYNNYCQPNMTVVENDALNLKLFYAHACRPGDWSTDPNYSKELRKKYPELCSLCDDPSTCTYRNNDHHGHIGALDCLTSNRGKVAYVALSHARRYFDEKKLTNNSYKFLCPDGTVDDLNTTKPCAWIRQPWDVIVAAKDKVQDIKIDLGGWLNITNDKTPSEYWIQALNKLLRNDNKVVSLPEGITQKDILARGRDVDLTKTPTCGNDVRWCTLNDLETHKCEWVAKEALALGIEPKFTCHNTSSVFQCLRDIGENKADIITIDSNYGHLARQVYSLSTVVYCDPEENKNSEIVAIVQEPRPGTTPDISITSFQSLKDRHACFPEYGGIAWLSFINVARTNGLFSSKSCDYPKLVANYFSAACTPGIKDRDHTNSSYQIDAGVASKLCSICPDEVNSGTMCSASPLNKFYGDEGALKCLEEGAGDVAFVEVKNLKSLNVDENRYRILCKNGSLSARPGFYFDEACALSATIDSEIVSRKINSKTISHDITHALMKMQRWMGYRENSPRPIRIYEKFNGTTDLLFKDNTSGMVSKDSTKTAVLAYKELFSHLEACSDAATMAYINLLSIIQVIFLTYLLK